MTASTVSSSAVDGWPWRRLLPALAGSVLVHYLIAAGWQSSGGVGQAPAQMPYLQALLEIPARPPAASTAGQADEAAQPAPVRPAAISRSPVVHEEPSAAAPAGRRPAEGAGAALPDPRFYPARELDRYPLALAPLDLRTGAGKAGTVRFWVGIDLAGNVVDVAVDGEPGPLAALAREHLLAMRFTPGVRDERPVKSRILLELRYGP